jgi:hypothetical protein
MDYWGRGQMSGASSALIPELPGRMTVRSPRDIEKGLAQVKASASRTQTWLARQSDDPLKLFRLMKFDRVGCHPIDDGDINLFEQINQTWSYVAAVVAARWLLKEHVDAVSSCPRSPCRS